MKRKYLYQWGKRKFKKPTGEYFTDGNEFDELHRFTPKEVRDLNDLAIGKKIIIYDEYFKADEIRVMRVE